MSTPATARSSSASTARRRATSSGRSSSRPPTRSEEGYVNYDLHQGVEDPGVFFCYENWESPEALDAHLAAPHLEQCVGVMDDLLDGGLHITRLRRVA